MSKRLQDFYHSLCLALKPPAEAELERARQMLAEFRQRIDAVKPEDRVKELSPKFWDDTSGTEFDRRRNPDRAD